MNKWRRRVLNKLAQTAPATNTNTQQKTVAGAPNAFIASQRWPQIITMWGQDAPKVDQLFNLLNTAAFYTSGGEKQMTGAKDGLGGFAERQISDPGSEAKGNESLKKIITLIQKSITNLTIGPRQLTEEDMKIRLNQVLNDPSLTSMSSVNQGGQLATKMPADTSNLRSAITNLLRSFRVMITPG